jgi:hypothetical protein
MKGASLHPILFVFFENPFRICDKKKMERLTKKESTVKKYHFCDHN